MACGASQHCHTRMYSKTSSRAGPSRSKLIREPEIEDAPLVQ